MLKTIIEIATELFFDVLKALFVAAALMIVHTIVQMTARAFTKWNRRTNP